MRKRAWAPYSRFKVGAALRAESGAVYVGCNVEKRGLPRGHLRRGRRDCRHGRRGDTRIAEITVIADSPEPVPCCGGCRQKIAEFAGPEVRVTMATTEGKPAPSRWPSCCPASSPCPTWTAADGRPQHHCHHPRWRPARRDQLAWFAQGLASGAVTDAQAGAFAMAVLLKGRATRARVALTRAMRDSGRVMQWDLPGPVVDKHSTGGIGDCISLLLAPALAVCGAYVPMISGRGLGHTGGTLDKLEAIPGFRTGLAEPAFRAQVAELGCAIVAASADLAPADKRLYAIRDVTGTVESIDLITASILSKKLAAGLEALVLDVKCGSGAS